MKYLFVIILLGLFLALPALSQTCITKNESIVGKKRKLISVESSMVSIKHQVYGSVTFNTACTFQIRNITVIPSGNGVYWYGIPLKNTSRNEVSEPYPRIVTRALGSYNGQTELFALDPQYGFDDLSIMVLWSEGDNRAYGAFPVHGNITDFIKTDVTATELTDEDIDKALSSGTIAFKDIKYFNVVSWVSYLMVAVIVMLS